MVCVGDAGGASRLDPVELGQHDLDVAVYLVELGAALADAGEPAKLVPPARRALIRVERRTVRLGTLSKAPP
jgi:hypothetical protein